MTHDQALVQLILAVAGLVAALAAAVPGILALATARENRGVIDGQKQTQAEATARQDRQAAQINYLSNGGGDAKIEAQLQRHRLIDAPYTSPSTFRPPVLPAAAVDGDTGREVTGDGLTGPIPAVQVQGGTE